MSVLLSGYSTLVSNGWLTLLKLTRWFVIMFIPVTRWRQAWNAYKQTLFVLIGVREHVRCRPFSYPNANTLHWRRGDLLHLLDHGSVVKLLLRAYIDAWTIAPQPSPDYSISQFYCRLKIRWWIHAVEAYLSRAHTLWSMGFHYKFPQHTSGVTQLMPEFVSFIFTLHHIDTW